MRRSVILLLSVCAVIVGCSKTEDDPAVFAAGAVSLFDPTAVNPSLCGAAAIPFPNNALFASATSPTGITTDTTLNIPSAASTAVAANLTDGWSTTASAFFDVVGLVDYASAADGIIVLETAPTPRILQIGVDYTVQPSVAMGQATGTGGPPPSAPSCTATPGLSRFLPILQQRSRILIEPLIPLKASTTYIVAVTKGLKSLNGAPVAPNEFFPIVNRDDRLCRLAADTVDATPACSDATAPATLAASVHPVLGLVSGLALNPATGAEIPPGAAAASLRLTTLETLRRNLIRPTVLAFQQLAAAPTTTPAPVAVTDDDLVIAWSFTTQSIGATLQTLNGIQTAKTFAVANAGVDTGDLGLADTANIFVGRLNAVPYYLDAVNEATDTQPQKVASQLGFWHNNGVVTSAGSGGFVPFVSTPTAPVPCTLGGATPFNWVAPVSTTNCFRIPVAGGNDAQGNPWGSLEDLPVMITVPKTARPTNGWPVVIFQHGITGNRTQMLGIAPTLASAGFVTVAIDLPLHGIFTGPFFQDDFERHFELDVATGAGSCLSNTAGDGTPDPSGTCFINLGSLITSRDNLRQAEADLIHVVKSLQAVDATNLDLDADGATDDIDGTQIHFVGLSLGSIVGATMLGVNTDVQAASLSVPGGGLGKLLDSSATFGPVIAAGLAGTAFLGLGSTGVNSPFEGTDTYETFVRFAQHLTDPGDPINFAVAADTNHPIHLTMVENDTVVPNHANTTCPAPTALPPGVGATATPDNSLAATRDAACDAGILLVGTNSTTQAACNGGVLVDITSPVPQLCPRVTSALLGGATVQDEVILTGFLSGTEPLSAAMGLTASGLISALPADCATDSDATELDVIVEFATPLARHGTLLSPDADSTTGNGNDTALLATTQEMQRQTVSYLLSGGTDLDVLGTCP
jgi:dienelactone hydrolase